MVLRHTFEALSNLYKLLPNRLMELLYSHKSEEDQRKCENSEFSGLERILERHQFPKEIHLTPKPSSMPLWRRKANNENQGWKKCHVWNKTTKEPPMSTIVVSELHWQHTDESGDFLNPSRPSAFFWSVSHIDIHRDAHAFSASCSVCVVPRFCPFPP
uniref:Uncharacterized protein n=1 Tax=Sus scrofa TaxID=9823 RepID=A0A8D1RBL9_PIG